MGSVFSTLWLGGATSRVERNIPPPVTAAITRTTNNRFIFSSSASLLCRFPLWLERMSEHSTDSVIRNRLGLTRPLVLVGLMGAGKTTIGRRLARDIGLDFYDSDNEIVEAAGCSIADIFAVHGETIFRDLEQRVLLRLISGEPAVIATGGGAFMNVTTREAIRAHAISLWLRADLDVLVERVSRRNHRPLLEQGDKHEILARLMEERYPVYAEADLSVDSGHGAYETIVREIEHLLLQKREEV